MSTNWNWLDEIQRLADSYTRNPPTSISQLLDEFSKLVPSSTGTGTGFDDFIDNVRDQTSRSTDRMAQTTGTKFTKHDVEFFTCPNPSCGKVVKGSVTYALEPTSGASLPTEVTFTGKVTGVDVKHNCVPKVTR